MQNVLNFTSTDILKINANDPEKLFSVDNFIVELKQLRKKWHPDYNTSPASNETFVHVQRLGIAAKLRIKDGTWRVNSVLQYTTKSGSTFKFKYKKYREFELGKMYIGQKYVTYVLSEENKDLFENGVKAIKGITYPDSKMKSEFKKLLPSITQSGEADIGFVVVIEKPKNSILLEDLLEYMPDNKVIPEHAAWITSSMYNIAMFLNHLGITHNSILSSTVFVDVDNHACYLLGGWWYSVKEDTKLLAVPNELVKILPKELFTKKTGDTIYDRQAIKALAIRCLGDTTLVGSKLLFDKNTPKPFISWVRTPSIPSALEEYKGWIKALENSYGKRKFVKFNHKISDIYKEN